jgi:hypothetical protein
MAEYDYVSKILNLLGREIPRGIKESNFKFPQT